MTDEQLKVAFNIQREMSNIKRQIDSLDSNYPSDDIENCIPSEIIEEFKSKALVVLNARYQILVEEFAEL